MAGSTGLEPATSGVTGQRSNQLNYDPAKATSNFVLRTYMFQLPTQPPAASAFSSKFEVGSSKFELVGGTGLEPVTAGV